MPYRIQRATLLVATSLLALLPAAAFAAERLELRPWQDDLRPPVLERDSTIHAQRTYPPDAVDDSARPVVRASYALKLPACDGTLDDWPLVRWLDIRGSGAVESGPWGGPADAAFRFAILWTQGGLLFGGTLVDDTLTSDADARKNESVVFAVASSSPVVQRYWRAGERSFRVRADGSVQAWTRLRNRRNVEFDAKALGARASARSEGRAGANGRLVFELFVPWDQLFPALPHAQAGLLVNVLVEDVDAGARKTLAWSTNATGGKPQRTWSKLSFTGAPPSGAWAVSVATRHIESGQPCEWSVLRWGDDSRSARLVVRRTGANGATPELRATLSDLPAIVRLAGIPPAPLPWSEARRFRVDIGLEEEEPWRSDDYMHAPGQASFVAGLAELRQSRSAVQREGFPQPEDVIVRVKRAFKTALSYGTWSERIYHDTGILVSRAASWAALEEDLAEIDALRALVRSGSEATAARRRIAEIWPLRTAQGHPVGQTFLRGLHSDLDDTVQPYALYISTNAAQAAAAPLVVALHGHKQDELALFEMTALAAEIESRGWIALSPYGRGDTGFQLAGERDVLDAIDAVVAELPVDPARLYLTGFSMGGTGAWLLSLRHPQLFAAANIVSGFGDMDQPGMFEALGYHPDELFYYETQNPVRLVRPDLTTAYRIVHAENDPLISVVHARIMADRLTQFGIEHDLQLPRLAQHSVGFFNSDLPASFEFFATQRRAAAGQANPAWFAGRGGPIATVFPRGPFTVVYGTRPLPASTPPVGTGRRAKKPLTGPAADRRTADQFGMEWEAIFSGQPRAVADTAVTPRILKNHNLVLVGDPRTNRLLSQVAEDLPVQYSGDAFEVEGQTFGFAQYGIIYATANPAAPDRTLLVLSAMGERLGGFSKSLLKLGVDYVVTDDQHNFAAIGHFQSMVGSAPRSHRSPSGGK